MFVVILIVWRSEKVNLLNFLGLRLFVHAIIESWLDTYEPVYNSKLTDPLIIIIFNMDETAVNVTQRFPPNAVTEASPTRFGTAGCNPVQSKSKRKKREQKKAVL